VNELERLLRVSSTQEYGAGAGAGGVMYKLCVIGHELANCLGESIKGTMDSVDSVMLEEDICARVYVLCMII
jgi:hypothetical protein